jgi:hypothetical protein
MVVVAELVHFLRRSLDSFLLFLGSRKVIRDWMDVNEIDRFEDVWPFSCWLSVLSSFEEENLSLPSYIAVTLL